MSDKTQNISFLLGDEQITIDVNAPDISNMTVLEYLRDIKHLKGTKEGCGEGDCGACTVVVVEESDGVISHKAVNSCIQFLPTLDGKQLLSVEHVKDHPAIAALAQNNASQCGFCTPGFAMSLVAMSENGTDNINDDLAGNLCRCTGYGTIIGAAKSLAHNPTNDPSLVKMLKELKRNTTRTNGEHYFAPTSIAELAEIYQNNPQATLLAGGTDVGLWVTKQHAILDKIIYLGNVAELKTISEYNSHISIGAGVTYTEAIDIINQHYPSYGEIIRRTGAKQVRNVGTIGGNIANGSPIGDSPPVLIALGASMILRLGDKTRELPIEEFFIDYGKQDIADGEFITQIILPKNQALQAYKISKRSEQDISAVLGAFSIDVENDVVVNARIAFGGMAGTPKRATACEQALLGKAFNMKTIERAMQAMDSDFTPLSDMRATASYRMSVAKNLLKKCYIESSGADE